MKKLAILFLAISFLTLPKLVLALDLDKIAGAVSGSSSDDKKAGNPLDKVLGKLDGRLDKVIDRMEAKLNKYEQTIDKAQKATDKIATTLDNIDSSKIEGYIKIAKYVAIAVAVALAILIILLIAVFIQLIKVNASLRKSR